MADTKLSALTELAAAPASDDEVYIRDVSEAAADESKRITIANLVAAAVQSGAITDGVTKAPTHDAVYDVKVTADTATTPAEAAQLVTDHNNNTTTAHGAVSAATASKFVVRDANARAKFAAPAAAGDALIKGTALTITEMAALTTGKIWQGVANRPSEVNMPSGSTVATGSYTGNVTARQIATGFKCSMVVIQTTNGAIGDETGILIPSMTIHHSGANHTDSTANGYLHATNGFSLSTSAYFNNNASTYYYWAISE
uniref:Tail protein n=1 Tax=viral metagenome TaxID=1070528 RepID=A0A6M3LG04_9ZZZZ